MIIGKSGGELVKNDGLWQCLFAVQTGVCLFGAELKKGAARSRIQAVPNQGHALKSSPSWLLEEFTGIAFHEADGRETTPFSLGPISKLWAWNDQERCSVCLQNLILGNAHAIG